MAACDCLLGRYKRPFLGNSSITIGACRIPLWNKQITYMHITLTWQSGHFLNHIFVNLNSYGQGRGFGERIHWFRADRRSIRVKNGVHEQALQLGKKARKKSTSDILGRGKTPFSLSPVHRSTRLFFLCRITPFFAIFSPQQNLVSGYYGLDLQLY